MTVLLLQQIKTQTHTFDVNQAAVDTWRQNIEKIESNIKNNHDYTNSTIANDLRRAIDALKIKDKDKLTKINSLILLFDNDANIENLIKEFKNEKIYLLSSKVMEKLDQDYNLGLNTNTSILKQLNNTIKQFHNGVSNINNIANHYINPMVTDILKVRGLFQLRKGMKESISKSPIRKKLIIISTIICLALLIAGISFVAIKGLIPVILVKDMVIHASKQALVAYGTVALIGFTTLAKKHGWISVKNAELINATVEQYLPTKNSNKHTQQDSNFDRSSNDLQLPKRAKEVKLAIVNVIDLCVQKMISEISRQHSV